MLLYLRSSTQIKRSNKLRLSVDVLRINLRDYNKQFKQLNTMINLVKGTDIVITPSGIHTQYRLSKANVVRRVWNGTCAVCRRPVERAYGYTYGFCSHCH